MRTITLNKMRIENFKGIENLEISFDGKNTLIAGTNGIGKSTIVDAYLWATTGKNMAGHARFEVRPRDKRGNEVHDVITTVECEFVISDTLIEDNNEFIGTYSFTIRRDELEDLTKKDRENLKPETIAPKKSYYFIDGAPYDAKIFYDKLGKIMCDKDKFSILSNPFAFFMLTENVQREMLTAACGDVQDSEIENYDKVKEICGAVNTSTQVKDGLTKSIRSTNKRLAEIPAQVTALSQNCDEYMDYGKKIAELEKEQIEVKAQDEKLKSELSQNFGISPIMLPQPPSNMDCEIAERNYNYSCVKVMELKKDLEHLQSIAKANVCPNCGYDLNNTQKSIDMIKERIEQAEQTLNANKKEFEQAIALYEVAMQEYNAKAAEQSKAHESESGKRKSLETCIDKLRARYTELSVEIGNLRNAQKVQSQIKSLRDEQRNLDSILADDMTKLDIITAFILKKAERVVENINKRFTKVKFKLFEMQANGELKTCCKAMKDGVSYPGINTAAKVQVGIEVAKLFSEFYGVNVPLWVDYKESVIELPKTDAQVICLEVDKQFKELHIEEM